MPAMHPDSLARLDLNLLLALDALIAEKSITRAGHRLGVTQSAMSRSLLRLRASFGDPLLIKSGRSMVLTPRAEELREPLDRVLEEVRRLVRPQTFDPEVDHGTIRINTPSILALPEALIQIARAAPHLNVIVTNNAADPMAALTHGDSDLLIDSVRPVSEPFCRLRLTTGRFVCLLREGHPKLSAGGLTRADYAAATHVVVEVATRRLLDEMLAKQGVVRRSLLTVPNTVVAADLVAQTDWVLTTPEAIGPRLCAMFPLRATPFPYDGPELWLDVIWHRRSDRDPLHRWVRETIAGAIARI
ncbi:MAG: LysR family transcriptional regulator [Rhodospirillaceae bacterium]|nr:LysR family transcriptional regulator [Rhodospirillaceae bacterium]